VALATFNDSVPIGGEVYRPVESGGHEQMLTPPAGALQALRDDFCRVQAPRAGLYTRPTSYRVARVMSLGSPYAAFDPPRPLSDSSAPCRATTLARRSMLAQLGAARTLLDAQFGAETVGQLIAGHTVDGGPYDRPHLMIVGLPTINPYHHDERIRRVLFVG